VIAKNCVRKESVPVPLFPPQTLYGLPWDKIWASARAGQRLTANCPYRRANPTKIIKFLNARYKILIDVTMKMV